MKRESGSVLNWLDSLCVPDEPQEGSTDVHNLTPMTPGDVSGVTTKSYTDQRPDTHDTPDTTKSTTPGDTALRAGVQDTLRDAELTTTEWSLWREITGQVADHLGCNDRDRSLLLRQLAEQGAPFRSTLLGMARTHALPMTARFDFWQLAYPGHAILRVVTPTYAGFIAIPGSCAGAQLYHQATAVLSPVP
ncbi:hypothetical protein [Jeongeupia chitinilytica]|uniref:Uncharacterized protein n=1 Tax=Jeongeupia chitinilytica TaxID=1041641 RepID=A0ABQ3GZD8_9NEIS|nr:hypothetical protein [Jeongeupia chitinilytica]GHD62795.1 hypothetical protein GCM10007350_19030 [Jeongeupia chitinilytica]